MTEADSRGIAPGSIVQDHDQDDADNVPDTARMLQGLDQAAGGGVEEQHQEEEEGGEQGGQGEENGNQEDEEGRDNAVGAEAQNLLNMQNEIARPMSFLGFLRYLIFFLC